MFTCLVSVILLVSGATGCGKSEAQKSAELQAAQRYEARQKFKDALAALIVRTRGSTYSEFRQSQLDLETSYEANKQSLGDLQADFTNLSQLISATVVVWNRDLEYPDVTAIWSVKEDVPAMLVIRPSFAEKLNYTPEQRKSEPECHEHNYVAWGLAKTKEMADALENRLNKSE